MAKKPKLTLQQKRQVSSNRTRRMASKRPTSELDDNQLGEQQGDWPVWQTC